MYANHDLHYANHHHRDFSYYVLINVKEIFFWYIRFVVVKVVGEASEKCRKSEIRLI